MFQHIPLSFKLFYCRWIFNGSCDQLSYADFSSISTHKVGIISLIVISWRFICPSTSVLNKLKTINVFAPLYTFWFVSLNLICSPISELELHSFILNWYFKTWSMYLLRLWFLKLLMTSWNQSLKDSVILQHKNWNNLSVYTMSSIIVSLFLALTFLTLN